MKRIAFLGTGTMGAPMARNLAKAGFEIQAWNRSTDRARALEGDGARVFEDPADAARGCDGVITMLSDAGAVLDTAAPALEALAGGIWLQMSTIGVQGIERCKKLADEHGVTLVDAPVLGTREPADEGKLVVLASGDGDALKECDGVFDAIGSRTLRFEKLGDGTRCKLVVNSWVLGVTALVAETVSLAEALGVDPGRFFEAVEGGALDLPYARLKGDAMIERSFGDPAFRLALARKDADLVLAAAEEGRLEVPVLRAVSDRLNRAEHDGHGDEDMAANYLATANGHSR